MIMIPMGTIMMTQVKPHDDHAGDDADGEDEAAADQEMFEDFGRKEHQEPAP